MATLPLAENSKKPRPMVSLRRIGPAVVLICLVLDIALRFLPPRLIAFRAWESVTLFAANDLIRDRRRTFHS
jgi:hypothetical protein